MDRIDIERFSPRLGVNAHHGVHRGRPGLSLGVEQIELYALAPTVAELDLERCNALFQTLRQRLISRMH